MSEERRVVDSWDVWQWPEYKALAERLGIADKPMTRLVITLELEHAAKVTADYYGTEAQ